MIRNQEMKSRMLMLMLMKTKKLMFANMIFHVCHDNDKKERTFRREDEHPDA